MAEGCPFPGFGGLGEGGGKRKVFRIARSVGFVVDKEEKKPRVGFRDQLEVAVV